MGKYTLCIGLSAMNVLGVTAGLLAGSSTAAGTEARAWSETTWNGERAQVAVSGEWRAVVSLERGRLVHFGPAASGENLLFAPATRDDPNGWGGHRVWLGPQSEWPSVWPPANAWERSGAESVLMKGEQLELIMPATGDGWPRLTRTYAWSDDGLVCGVRQNGGTHEAQIIQILQVPSVAIVRATAHVDAATPEGFVVLQIGAQDPVRRAFPWPAAMAREGEGLLVMRATGKVEKFGFAPQPLRAMLPGSELTLARGDETGRIVEQLDAGYNTQVYLGREGVPFLEIEQLSPRFAAGPDGGSATILLRAEKLSP
jgi:hypothetical protein